MSTHRKHGIHFKIIAHVKRTTLKNKTTEIEKNKKERKKDFDILLLRRERERRYPSRPHVFLLGNCFVVGVRGVRTVSPGRVLFVCGRSTHAVGRDNRFRLWGIYVYIQQHPYRKNNEERAGP